MPSTVSNPKPKHKSEFEAIGTRWSIETPRALGAEKALIATFVEQYDKTFSRFRDDSLVAKLAATHGRYEFPTAAGELMQLYRELYRATDGAVTPLVGELLESAGYDKMYSLEPGEPRQVPAWDDVMVWNDSVVTTSRPVVLDVGAAGKGQLIDLVAQLLEDSGCDTYVIDASGDVKVRGYEEVIGLENPYDTSSVIGVVPVAGASLCASATNRRSWGDGWHHVVDPHTSRPVDAIVATWVIADTAMLADGLATALFFVEPEKLNQWDFTYVRLRADGTVERSPDFVGELYI